MDPERPRHVLVRDLVYPPGGPDRVEPRGGRHVALDRGARGGRVEAHRAAEEGAGVEVAEDHVRVRQGGPGPAPPIARRPRVRARAARPDPDEPALVDPRERAAPGADLDHVDDRQLGRQPAAALVLVDPADLEVVLLEGREPPDEGPLGGGAAHVEREKVREPEAAPVAGGHEGAGRRAGLQGPDREAPRRLRDDRSPGRGHDVQPAREPERREPALEPLDVAVEHRLGVGVHRRGGPALVLAHVREDVGGAGDVQAGELAADEGFRGLLVRGVGVGVEEADRERLDAGRVDQVPHRLAHAVRVQRLDHRAVGRDPLAHLPAAAARDERIGPPEPEVEQVVALLEAHVEDVAEPRGHEHPGRRPAPLDDRVGDEGGSVGDRVDLGHRDVLAGEEGGRALDHRGRGVFRGGEPLVDRDPAAALVEQGEVGERASDVHAEPTGHGQGLLSVGRTGRAGG